MMRLLACVIVGGLLAACGGGAGGSIVLGAGTTLVDSGFLPAVVAAYEAQVAGTKVSIVALSSAEAFAYADAGTADVIITHEPIGLVTFLAEHPHATTAQPFASSFVVVAPPGRDAAPRAVDAFAQVSAIGSLFVSRDDASGTNARELEIWAAIPFDPAGEEWYVRTGTGMGATLQVADQRGAVTLSELGAYLAVEATVSLRPVSMGDTTGLENPYDITLAKADHAEAAAFVEWLLSDDGRDAIAKVNDSLFGESVYRAP